MVSGVPAASRSAAAADAASPRWHVVGRSTRGASHLRSGAPNQDAVEICPQGPNGSPVIAAVADGHGGSRHFRSADGARLAVAVTTRILREIAPRFDAMSDADRSRLAAVDVPPRIVDAWVQAVRSELSRQPITPDELARVAEAEGVEAADSVRDDPLLAYGTTLLAVLVTPRCTALFQLGDGDVLSVAADGTTTRPIPRDERLGGNLTTSLCRAGSEADFRCVVLSHEQARPALLLLSTDGYANSFRTDADYLEVGRDFLELIRQHGIASIADRLPSILEHASQNGSGDDITLALLWRDASFAETPVVGGPRPASNDPIVAAPPSSELRSARQRIRQLRWIVAGLVVVVAAGLWWALRGELGNTLAGPKATRVGPVNAGAIEKDKDAGPPHVPVKAASGIERFSGAASAPASAVAAAIEAPRAVHQPKRGIEVSARVSMLPAEGASCTVRAAVFGAGDKELAAASSVLPSPVADAATIATQVKLLVPYPSDAAKAKALQAAKNTFSLRIDCAREAVAKTGRLAIDPA